MQVGDTMAPARRLRGTRGRATVVRPRGAEPVRATRLAAPDRGDGQHPPAGRLRAGMLV